MVRMISLDIFVVHYSNQTKDIARGVFWFYSTVQYLEKNVLSVLVDVSQSVHFYNEDGVS